MALKHQKQFAPAPGPAGLELNAFLAFVQVALPRSLLDILLHPGVDQRLQIVPIGKALDVEHVELEVELQAPGKLVGASEVLAVAMLARLTQIFCSLPGAIVAVTGPKLPEAKAIEKELNIAGDSEPDRSVDAPAS